MVAPFDNTDASIEFAIEFVIDASSDILYSALNQKLSFCIPASRLALSHGMSGPKTRSGIALVLQYENRGSFRLVQSQIARYPFRARRFAIHDTSL